MRVKTEMVCTTSKFRYESEIAKNETNDCVVRAIAAAFEVPYDLAHSFCARTFKRAPKQGTLRSADFFSKESEVLGKKVVEMGDYPFEGATYKRMLTYYKSKTYWGEETPIQRQMTVYTFLKQYRNGNYMLYVPGHAFAVKDGIIYGNPEDANSLRRRIFMAFRVI